MTNIPNQDTLSAALELVEQGVAASKYPTFKEGVESFRDFYTFCGGIQYDENRTRSFELETGKPKARRPETN